MEAKGQAYQYKKIDNCLYVFVVEKLEETKVAIGPAEQKRVEGLTRQEAFEGRASLLIVLPYERLKPVMN